MDMPPVTSFIKRYGIRWLGHIYASKRKRTAKSYTRMSASREKATRQAREKIDRRRGRGFKSVGYSKLEKKKKVIKI